jgi:hypothetical protein
MAASGGQADVLLQSGDAGVEGVGASPVDGLFLVSLGLYLSARVTIENRTARPTFKSES